MMSSGAVEETSVGSINGERKYKGVRRRRWGKWVSEIRVPGTQQERLWLGSYSTPEAAAIAHDIAFYCLRRPSSLNTLNFPSLLPPSLNANMSPNSIQKAASDAGMAVDAQLILGNSIINPSERINSTDRTVGIDTDPESCWEDDTTDSGSWKGSTVGIQGEALSISVEDYL